MINPTNLNPNPVEAAVQALRDRKDGVHASPDALLLVIKNLLVERGRLLRQVKAEVLCVDRRATRWLAEYEKAIKP